jgi:hypothetical protein
VAEQAALGRKTHVVDFEIGVGVGWVDLVIDGSDWQREAGEQGEQQISDCHGRRSKKGKNHFWRDETVTRGER